MSLSGLLLRFSKDLQQQDFSLVHFALTLSPVSLSSLGTQQEYREFNLVQGPIPASWPICLLRRESSWKHSVLQHDL